MVSSPEADWNVTDGMMKITTAGAGVWRTAYYDEDYSNFVYEVEMQRNTGAEGGSMGVIVRANGHTTLTAGDESNGLMFCVSGYGSYFYGTITDGELPDWSGWLTSSAINQGFGAVNVVSVEASGTVVKFFINNTLVHTQVTTIASGYCGVFAHEGDVAAEVAWDSFIVVPEATAMNYDVAEGSSIEGKGYLENVVSTFDSPGKLANGLNILPAQTSTRALLGYNVYRGACGAEDEDMIFMGYTLDEQFTDNTWGTVTEGIYSYGIVSVYDFNESEFTYSNCLDKDMVAIVSVEVTTNSGDSPIETEVMFINVSEPTDPILVYEVELDDTGMYTWDEFRKGTYDIFVHKNGFADIMLEGVDIWDATDFEFVLEELLAPVTNLYVTPLGYATWGVAGEVPFVPYAFDFEADVQEWEIQGNVAGWQWGNNASLSSGFMNYDGNTTNFIAVNADAEGIGGDPIVAMAKSPLLDLTNADMAYLTFDYTLRSDDMSVLYSIEGSDPVLIEVLAESSQVWTSYTIELPEEILESDVQIIFLYEESGTWGYGGAVDNVAVVEELEDARYADRELEYYKVFHDYNFITDTDTTLYQYGDNGEVLVPGETYMAEVAVVYSTGMSAKMF